MEHVQWSARPRLHDPVLIAAFEGWNDAGDAATTAAGYLRDQLDARPFATIDPEDYYDFTVTRPHVRLGDGGERVIEWPHNELSAATLPGGGDVIVLLGVEPQLRWRTYCEQVIGVASALDARMVLTLGALLAEVPHTQPTQVIGTAVDTALLNQLGFRRSTYEGPTGIVGVLHDLCAKAGLTSASLWAAVPAYVPGAPSPKAALALVERVGALLETSVPTTELEIAAAAYERQVSEVVEADEEMREYVTGLESRTEPGDDRFASGAALVEEVERFLRDQEPGER